MRIAIVGAGAIGCFLAARLKDAGHTITLVGRGEQVAAIRRNGLVLIEQNGERRGYAIDARETLDEQPEVALLTVKTQDVTDACQAIAPALGRAPVMAMQNGLEGDRIAAGVLGREAVMGAVVMCATTYLQPGEVSVQFAGWLIAGEPFGGVRSRTREVAAALSEGLPTYVSRHLTRTRWSKLIYNLNNGLSAATGLTLPEIARTPHGSLLSVRLMREGYRVARAAGMRLDHGLYGLSPGALRRDPNASLVALLQSTMTSVVSAAPAAVGVRILGAASRSRLNSIAIRGSTWQSIQRGKTSEIDYLNGYVARLGRQLGVPTPYNARVVEIVHDVERTHSFRGIEDLLPLGVVQPQHVTAAGGKE